MITIRATAVQSTGGYARLVLPSGCPTPEAGGDDYSYHQVLGPEEFGESGIMAELICRKRALVLRTLERHLDTPEILAAMDGDVIVCAAAPGVDPARCTSTGVRAFMVRQGQALWMEKGTWHWLPFPVQAARVTMLLIFREGTGDHDIEFRDLEQPIAIETRPEGVS
jgi:ureidoglycolate hydrolase